MGHASFSEQLATPEVVPLTDGDHPSFIGSFLLKDISICDRLIKEHSKSKDVTCLSLYFKNILMAYKSVWSFINKFIFSQTNATSTV